MWNNEIEDRTHTKPQAYSDRWTLTERPKLTLEEKQLI